MYVYVVMYICICSILSRHDCLVPTEPLSRTNIHHALNIQLYDFNKTSCVNHVWVHVGYMYPSFPKLARIRHR